MRQMEECPLRWQLMHSRYGELRSFPERPRAAALVGKVVHAVLDALFRGLGERGSPPLGSPAFRQAMAEIKIMERIQQELSRYRMALEAHPRAAGLVILENERGIYNQVCQLFHGVYAQAQRGQEGRDMPEDVPPQDAAGWLQLLRTRGALTEVRLQHPELPLVGVLDLIWDGGGRTHIVDFKTGEEKPEHVEQLELYALLWFRVTGEIAGKLELCYPGTRRSMQVAEGRILEVEERLRARIAALRNVLASHPAAARPGAQCGHCDVRQFCARYWEGRVAVQAAAEHGRIDVELTVTQQLSAYVIVGQTAGGEEISVSFAEEVGGRIGAFAIGDKMRILGARAGESAREVRLLKSTEVFWLAC
jgi:hypothetical protein